MLTVCCTFLGCPSSPNEPNHPPSDGSATATTSVAASTAAPTGTAEPPAQTQPVEGTWVVVVTSSSPSINPAMFDSPDKKAKVFFDHEAKAVGGKVEVTQRTLGKTVAVKDAALAAELDRLVRGVDWPAAKQRTGSEEPSEGGTQFRFEVRIGEALVELQTADLDSHPELVKIVHHLKKIAGVP
ncbi:MAG: hypothetical protein JRI23_34205 [Deltaproteobacteria bacterium]|nr:hypothetical protein [Deltaproteobacteria bacterium]MBW2537351.1 hypothetical protein [Deltaproteobacteria bacterium]